MSPRASLAELLEMAELPDAVTAPRRLGSARSGSVRKTSLPSPTGPPLVRGPPAAYSGSKPQQPAAAGRSARIEPSSRGPTNVRTSAKLATVVTADSGKQTQDVQHSPRSQQPAVATPSPHRAADAPTRTQPNTRGPAIAQSSIVHVAAPTTPSREKFAPAGPVAHHASVDYAERELVTPPPILQSFRETHFASTVESSPKKLPGSRLRLMSVANKVSEETSQAQVPSNIADEVPGLSVASEASEKVAQPQMPISIAHESREAAASWELVPWKAPSSYEMVPVLPPEPVKKRQRRDVGALRGLDLQEVSLSMAAAENPADRADSRPRRRRIPPLEFWRNERVEYERLPGSDMPTIRAVVRNMATYGTDLLALENRPKQLAIEDGLPAPKAKRRRRVEDELEEREVATARAPKVEAKRGHLAHLAIEDWRSSPVAKGRRRDAVPAKEQKVPGRGAPRGRAKQHGRQPRR